jgi:hypothetical protein
VVEQRRRRRDLDDAGRLRDRLAPQAPGAARAVPLLVDVEQRRSDARPEPDALGHPRGDLAVRAAVALDQSGVLAVRGLEVNGGALGHELVAAEHPGRLVRVGRAADVLEQRRVVDVLRVLRADRGRELRGQERRPRGLAGIEPHAGIGEQRQPGEQLREAQALHASTL